MNLNIFEDNFEDFSDLIHDVEIEVSQQYRIAVEQFSIHTEEVRYAN